MVTKRKLSIELDTDLAEKLQTAANGGGWTPESLAADCGAQQLEFAVRFRTLVVRFEQIDNNLAIISQFVGEITAPAEGVDLWKICRYRREKESC